jgi:SAM-dependent methyltransferase
LLGLKSAVRVPPYFDGLIEAFRQGHGGRFVHLGWWDTQAVGSDGFEHAQARLNERLMTLAEPGDGQRVLDVGCGFGGTLAALNLCGRSQTLIGLNIDPRQLAVCATLRARAGNTLHWLQADACALPLSAACLDRVLCFEAMFHFASRARFFAEAARVLRPGGLLVVSDIVVQPPADEAAAAVLAPRLQALHDGLGPWPQPLAAEATHATLAAAAGLQLARHIDGTAATLPSHAFTAPGGDAATDGVGRGAAALAALHRAGSLQYPLLCYLRR